MASNPSFQLNSKSLGFTLDMNLTLKEYNAKEIKAALYQLSLLKKVKAFLPKSDFRTAV